MTTLQAFLLGMMVAWTPSLILLGWFLLLEDRKAIGTALKAGYRWLDVYCGGCRQVQAVDLAAVDIHPQACLTPDPDV
jgi:hypothetical protein